MGIILSFELEIVYLKNLSLAETGNFLSWPRVNTKAKCMHYRKVKAMAMRENCQLTVFLKLLCDLKYVILALSVNLEDRL